MAAVPLKHANPSRAVTEGDEILAHDADGLRHIGQFFRQADRLPELAHQIAHRRARLRLRQFGIMQGNFPLIVGAIGHFPFAAAHFSVPPSTGPLLSFYQARIRGPK